MYRFVVLQCQYDLVLYWILYLHKRNVTAMSKFFHWTINVGMEHCNVIHYVFANIGAVFSMQQVAYLKVLKILT